MEEYVYWQSDDNPTYIVRQKGGLFEDYKRGRGWSENPERFDIISGIDPYYSVISKEQVQEIVSKLEK